MENFTELLEYPTYFISANPPMLQRIKGDKVHICTQTPNSKQDNYWVVTIKTPQGVYVKRSMHRLLMETFEPNPLNKAHVNHIDGDKSNNLLSNLEWATPKENAQHAIKMGLKSHDWAYKPVFQYTLGGQFVAEYTCDNLARDTTGIAKQNISKATLGKREHAGFFQWRRHKAEQIPSTKKKYIKGYIWDNLSFSSLKDLAIVLDAPNPSKVSKDKLKRYAKNLSISMVYHA